MIAAEYVPVRRYALIGGDGLDHGRIIRRPHAGIAAKLIHLIGGSFDGKGKAFFLCKPKGGAYHYRVCGAYGENALLLF